MSQLKLSPKPLFSQSLFHTLQWPFLLLQWFQRVLGSQAPLRFCCKLQIPGKKNTLMYFCRQPYTILHGMSNNKSLQVLFSRDIFFQRAFRSLRLSCTSCLLTFKPSILILTLSDPKNTKPAL